MIYFKVNTINQTDTQGEFVIEPLERGFGHTVGNCLRRVMLTALEGAAITSVKIDGVHHQFSTITGISEDVIEIILNLKKVRMKIFPNKPIKMRLSLLGRGEAKAGNIDTLGNGEIINPDLHVASLNSPQAKLSMELTAEKGVGYVLADEKKSEEIGVIPVDAIYSPVVSVTYQVDPTRVGRSTNYDKLTMQITTDGTIKAEDALIDAARILGAYFGQIVEPAPEEEVEVQPAVNDDLLKMSVEELDLPVRITNALKAIEVDTVGRLTNIPKNQLLKAKNLGIQSVGLISEKLSERGLSLSEA